MFTRTFIKQRPDRFDLNPFAPLAKGLVFAGLGFGGSDKPIQFRDSSLYGNHGTLTNMEPVSDWVFDPYLGRWVSRLDAGTEKIECLAVGLPTAVAAPWTIATWWRPDAYVSLANIFGFGPQLKSAIMYLNRYLTTFNNLYYFWGGNADWDTGIADDQDGAWHHVAVTSDGTNLRFYRDGVLRAGPTARSPNWQTASSYITYGAGHTAAASSINADVCDGLIYGRTLSLAEIQQLADPSNVLLTGLIRPPRRRMWNVGYQAPPAGTILPQMLQQGLYAGSSI